MSFVKAVENVNLKVKAFGKKFSFSTSYMLHVNTSYLHWVAVKYQ